MGGMGEERWSGFRPEDAILSPYYLKTRFLRSRCDFELAPTERGASAVISFSDEGKNYLSVLPVTGNYSFRFDEKTNTLYASTDMHMSGEAVNFKTYLVVEFPEDSVDAAETLISSKNNFRSGKKQEAKTQVSISA